MKPVLMPSGTKLKMTIIEPWDLVSAIGSGPFRATLVDSRWDEQSDVVSILLALEEGIEVESQKYNYLVGSPRHVGRTIADVIGGNQVAFSFVMITDDRAKSANPFDISWWRGGASLLADIGA